MSVNGGVETISGESWRGLTGFRGLRGSTWVGNRFIESEKLSDIEEMFGTFETAGTAGSFETFEILEKLLFLLQNRTENV